MKYKKWGEGVGFAPNKQPFLFFIFFFLHSWVGYSLSAAQPLLGLHLIWWSVESWVSIKWKERKEEEEEEEEGEKEEEKRIVGYWKKLINKMCEGFDSFFLLLLLLLILLLLRFRLLCGKRVVFPSFFLFPPLPCSLEPSGAVWEQFQSSSGAVPDLIFSVSIALLGVSGLYSSSCSTGLFRAVLEQLQSSSGADPHRLEDAIFRSGLLNSSRKVLFLLSFSTGAFGAVREQLQSSSRAVPERWNHLIY